MRLPISESQKADAAKALGVSRAHLHAILAGRARITAEMAARLEKGLGSDAGDVACDAGGL
jgi:addiction module HigA family antidote